MRNKCLLSMAIAIFFYANFVFAADPHYLNKDWYNVEKAGLAKEEVTSIVITNDPEIYEEASMLTNGSLIPIDDFEIEVSSSTDEIVETSRNRNERTNLPYWDIDGRGLVAFVREESQVVICFPEEDKLKLSRFAEGCFSFCKYIKNDDYELDEFDERKDHVRPEDEIDNEFYETDLISKLEYIEGFELIDTGEVANMSRLFYGDLNLEHVNLSHMETRNVENMSRMFEYCFHLLDIDVSTFNTSLVTNFNSMFKSCRQLRTLDLSFWDTSNATSMSFMFYDCQNLKYVKLENLNTENVQFMSHMFSHCQNLNTLDLSFLNTSNLRFARSMFENCNNLKILSISARLGRFGSDLRLFGIWKNMLDGSIYNYELVADKKIQLGTGLYFRIA